MKRSSKEDARTILKAAYEAPQTAILGLTASILCESGVTQDLIDEGDVDWFTLG